MRVCVYVSVYVCVRACVCSLAKVYARESHLCVI